MRRLLITPSECEMGPSIHRSEKVRDPRKFGRNWCSSNRNATLPRSRRGTDGPGTLLSPFKYPKLCFLARRCSNRGASSSHGKPQNIVEPLLQGQFGLDKVMNCKTSGLKDRTPVVEHSQLLSCTKERVWIGRLSFFASGRVGTDFLERLLGKCKHAQTHLKSSMFISTVSPLASPPAPLVAAPPCPTSWASPPPWPTHQQPCKSH